jgi:hypothetical protein
VKTPCAERDTERCRRVNGEIGGLFGLGTAAYAARFREKNRAAFFSEDDLEGRDRIVRRTGVAPLQRSRRPGKRAYLRIAVDVLVRFKRRSTAQWRRAEITRQVVEVVVGQIEARAARRFLVCDADARSALQILRIELHHGCSDAARTIAYEIAYADVVACQLQILTTPLTAFDLASRRPSASNLMSLHWSLHTSR